MAKTKQMKRITFSIFLALFSLTMFAQPAGFDRLYYSYKGEEGVVAIKIPGFILKLAGALADLEGEERQLLRSLRSVTVLTIEDSEQSPGVNFAREVNFSRPGGGYELLLEVHDGEEDVVIAAREINGRIRDLVIVVGGEDNVLVHVRGRMNRDLLEALAGVTGLDELEFTSRI
jgi:hypothetical protein